MRGNGNQRIAVFRSAPYGQCLKLIRHLRQILPQDARVSWRLVVQPGLDQAFAEACRNFGKNGGGAPMSAEPESVICHTYDRGRFTCKDLQETLGEKFKQERIDVAYVPLNHPSARGYWPLVKFLSSAGVGDVRFWTLDGSIEPVNAASYIRRRAIRFVMEFPERLILTATVLCVALYTRLRFGPVSMPDMRGAIRAQVIRFLGRSRHADFTKYKFFHQVFIETRSRCNSTCSFCPVSIGNDPREDALMPEELHDKIINELAEIEFRGHLAYYNNNEPLLDKRIPSFMKKTREKLPHAHIRILTNGLLLNEKVADEYFESGLDWLSINAYDDRVKPRLWDLACRLSRKYPSKRVDYRDRSLNEVMTNSGGAAPNKNALAEPILAFCEYPFYQLIINARGVVPLCCRDAYYQVKMGNARQNKLTEIWRNRQYQTIRKALLNDDRSITDICAKCDFLGLKSELSPTATSRLHRRLFRWASSAS